MIDLTAKLLEEFQPRERDPKRVSVSSVHALLNHWEDKPIDLLSAVRMTEGSAKHEMIQRLLPEYTHEKKLEYDIGDGFLLVGKADCLMEDNKHELGRHILEIKTSREIYNTAKEWHVTQARLYATMFEVPFVFIVQPCFTFRKLYLKKLRKVGRNDEWFEKTCGAIKNLTINKYGLGR